MRNPCTINSSIEKKELYQSFSLFVILNQLILNELISFNSDYLSQ